MRLLFPCLLLLFSFSSAICEEVTLTDSVRSQVLEQLDKHYGGITFEGLLRQAITLPDTLFVHKEVHLRGDLISEFDVVYGTPYGSLVYLQYREQGEGESTLRRIDMYALREWEPFYRALIGQSISSTDSVDVSAENYADLNADGRVDTFISPYIPRSSSSGPVEIISGSSLSERELIIQNNYTLYMSAFRDFVVDAIVSLLINGYQ